MIYMPGFFVFSKNLIEISRRHKGMASFILYLLSLLLEFLIKNCKSDDVCFIYEDATALFILFPLQFLKQFDTQNIK